MKDLPISMLSESYWQIGFNHGYALAEKQPPDLHAGELAPRNAGYYNGYLAGLQKRQKEMSNG